MSSSSSLYSTTNTVPPHLASESSYWTARAALLSEESSRKRRHVVAPASFSSLQSKASRIIDVVKEKERVELWDSDVDASAYPGMPFRQAIARGMRDTMMWDILREMPKGSLLHCHMDGTVGATWLIQHALQYDHIIHIRAEEPILKLQDLYDVQVHLKPIPSTQPPSTSANIFSPEYDAMEWMSLKDARQLFPFENVYATPLEGFQGGIDLPSEEGHPHQEAGLIAWLHSLMTMTPVAGSKSMTTSSAAWERFMTTFEAIEGILSYEPILAAYIKQMVFIHAQDHIQYLETRLNFLTESFVSTDGSSPLTHSRWVEIFRDSVNEANAELRSQGKGECQCKIIYATVRFVTCERLRWYLEDCLLLAKSYPDLIVGFDLVGWEDALKPLRDYLPELLRFKQRQIQEGVEIPFILHAGETLGDGNAPDENLLDALLLGTKRLGHAFSLVKHPVLMEQCRSRNICIESCPISNQALRYVENMAVHPVSTLVNHGLPVALSNDDPCQFGNYGLTHDFWQVVSANSASGGTLELCKTFALDSLEHSRLTKEERISHGERFERDWNRWMEWVVEKYGVELEEEEEEETGGETTVGRGKA